MRGHLELKNRLNLFLKLAYMFIIFTGTQSSSPAIAFQLPIILSDYDRSECSDEELNTLNGFSAVPRKQITRVRHNLFNWIDYII